MTDSMAQAHANLVPLDVPRWRSVLSLAAALTLAALFLASGLWKITDAPGAAVRMAQARVPEGLSLAAAIGFGIAETAAAVIILVPRLRRWGAMTIAALLVVFLVWVGVHYGALRGAECSCVPLLKRVVGPGFFVGDVVMLGFAALAGVWAPRPRGVRTMALIAGVVTVFALVSWGAAAARQTGTKAPDTIAVEGRAYSLQQGRILLFFFDPECMHCFDAAQKLARMKQGETKVVGVPITHPEFAPQFANDTGLRMALTSDHERLKKVFPYSGVPMAVVLENGREKAALTRFEGEEPGASLRSLGME